MKRLAGVLGFLAAGACGGAPVRTEAPVVAEAADAGVADAARAVVAPIAPDPLNLGFEVEADDGGPDGWYVWGAGYIFDAIPEAAHSGGRGVRLRAVAPTHEDRAVIVRALPFRPRLGQIVRVTGWLRPHGIERHTGLWLDAQDASGETFRVEISQVGAGHDGEWTPLVVAMRVPRDAVSMQLGAELSGDGSVDIDDLAYVVEEAGAGPALVDGVVRAADGHPVPGAVVTAAAFGEVAQVVESDGQGRFSLAVDARRSVVGVVAPDGKTARLPPHVLADREQVELRLPGSEAPIHLAGQVRSRVPLPEDALVVVRREHVEQWLLAAPVGADGRFALELPVATGYRIELRAPGWVAESVYVRAGAEARLDAFPAAAAPPAVVGWIAGSARPIDAFEVGHGFADLSGVARTVGAARVVGFGQASRGARELNQLAHRVLELLVDQRGFDVLALDADQEEVRALDAYVTRGVGDAAAILRGIWGFGTGTWIWNTQELLETIEWMRAYNADARHKRRLHVVGLDASGSRRAWRELRAYLGRVDPEHALPGALDDFSTATAGYRWPGRSRVERLDRTAAIDALAARLDARRKDYVRRSGAEEWQVAREQARLLAQAARIYEHLDVAGAMSAARLDAMAENLAALLARDPRHKVLVWTTSELATRASTAFEGSLGTRLARTLGARYVALGSVFADGEVMSLGLDSARIDEHVDRVRVPAAAAPDAGEAFAASGHLRCYLDLHGAPRGEVAAWLDVPHDVRQERGYLPDATAWLSPTRLAAAFDGVVFVHTVTPARPNGARRW